MFNEIFNRTDLIEKLISEKFKSLKHSVFLTRSSSSSSSSIFSLYMWFIRIINHHRL